MAVTAMRPWETAVWYLHLMVNLKISSKNNMKAGTAGGGEGESSQRGGQRISGTDLPYKDFGFSGMK